NPGIDVLQCLRRNRDGSRRGFQSSMEKDGHASIAVVRRHESGLFSLLGCHAKRGEGEGAWLCPIVSRRIFEGPIVTTKENREITRLKIDNRHISAMVTVEVASEPKIRSCIGTGITSWLERPIAVTEKGCETILHTVDHKEITDPVMIEIGETHPERSLSSPIIGGRAKRTVAIPHPDGDCVQHRPPVGHSQINLPIAIQVGQCYLCGRIALYHLHPSWLMIPMLAYRHIHTATHG